MLIIDYLKEWGNQRPRNLMKFDNETGEQRDLINSHERICKILMLKRRPALYLIGKLNPTYDQPNGIHIFKRLYSAIFIVNSGNLTFFYLAHELYHEYQQEKYINDFYNISDEEREIEADGFAVAYIEYMELNHLIPDRKEFIPQNIDHVFYSTETKNTIKDDMPLKIREFADKVASEFHLKKKW